MFISAYLTIYLYCTSTEKLVLRNSGWETYPLEINNKPVSDQNICLV